MLWGKQAETLKDYLLKGRQIYVEGRLQTRQWDDKDGNKRYTTEIRSDRVVLLGGRGGNTGEGSGGGGDYGNPRSSGSSSSSSTSGGSPGPPPELTEDDIPF